MIKLLRNTLNSRNDSIGQKYVISIRFQEATMMKSRSISPVLRKSLLLIIAGIAFVALHPVSAQETITFPSRSSDLANDSYWTVSEFGEGCCTIDFNIRRWDGDSWNKGTGSATNNQDYDWNTPLYAPANGVIASCWRNFPDDPQPGVNPPNNAIFTGGNHAVIITDQDNAISIAHLKSGSMPANLCPPDNGNGQNYPATIAKEGAWRVAAYIQPEDRPRVTEGDFIGRAGNSGNSSGPHLHMSLSPVTGTDSKGREALGSSEAMRFRHAWGHRFEAGQQHTSDGWYRLRGGEFSGNPDCATWQANSPDCGFKTVHPSPYLRRADAEAGAIKGGDTLFISGNRAVTATIAASDDTLKLIGWDLVGVDAIVRKGDITAGAIKDVKLSEPTDGYVLAAVRQSNDLLKMIAYKVTVTGGFQRVHDLSAGKISALSMVTTGSGDKKAMTAVRDQAGNLKVIAWDIDVANDGTAKVVRLGDISAGAVSAVSIARARNFDGVFVGVRDSAGNLKVIPYKISADGKTLTRGDAAQAGAVGSAIAVAPLAKGVAAAVRDSDGNLRVITWSSNANGDIGARRDTGLAGKVSEISFLTAPHGGSNLTTVVRNAEGDLMLIGWAVNDTGTNLRRLGSSKAGKASQISADIVSRSYPGLDPRDMILTGVKTASGDLKLITWDTNLVNP